MSVGLLTVGLMNPKGERYENDSCCGRCDLNSMQEKHKQSLQQIITYK